MAGLGDRPAVADAARFALAEPAFGDALATERLDAAEHVPLWREGGGEGGGQGGFHGQAGDTAGNIGQTLFEFRKTHAAFLPPLAIGHVSPARVPAL